MILLLCMILRLTNIMFSGSQIAQASSTDLRNWSYLETQGYTNTSLYAASTFEGYYYIKNKNSGLYLDVVNGASANGTNIQQWAI